MANDEESKLGTTPLPDGTFRVFRDNGRDGLSFLVAQPIKYIPIGDKIELNLGADPEVIFELVKLRRLRDNIWMQIHGTDIFRRVQRRQRRNRRAQLGGRLGRAHALRPANSQLHEQADRGRSPPQFGGHVVFRSELVAKNHDYQTVEYTATVKPGDKADLKYEIGDASGPQQQAGQRHHRAGRRQVTE